MYGLLLGLFFVYILLPATVKGVSCYICRYVHTTDVSSSSMYTAYSLLNKGSNDCMATPESSPQTCMSQCDDGCMTVILNLTLALQSSDDQVNVTFQYAAKSCTTVITNKCMSPEEYENHSGVNLKSVLYLEQEKISYLLDAFRKSMEMSVDITGGEVCQCYGNACNNQYNTCQGQGCLGNKSKPIYINEHQHSNQATIMKITNIVIFVNVIFIL